jgi:hypothetical protein
MGILKWILQKWDEGTDCIDLAENSDRWRAVVNAVMNLRVPIKCGKFLE